MLRSQDAASASIIGRGDVAIAAVLGVAVAVYRAPRSRGRSSESPLPSPGSDGTARGLGARCAAVIATVPETRALLLDAGRRVDRAVDVGTCRGAPKMSTSYSRRTNGLRRIGRRDLSRGMPATVASPTIDCSSARRRRGRERDPTLEHARRCRDPWLSRPGIEPVWLRNGEEFLYSIDPYHAADIFAADYGLRSSCPIRG